MLDLTETAEEVIVQLEVPGVLRREPEIGTLVRTIRLR